MKEYNGELFSTGDHVYLPISDPFGQGPHLVVVVDVVPCTCLGGRRRGGVFNDPGNHVHRQNCRITENGHPQLVTLLHAWDTREKTFSSNVLTHFETTDHTYRFRTAEDTEPTTKPDPPLDDVHP